MLTLGLCAGRQYARTKIAPNATSLYILARAIAGKTARDPWAGIRLNLCSMPRKRNIVERNVTVGCGGTDSEHHRYLEPSLEHNIDT